MERMCIWGKRREWSSDFTVFDRTALKSIRQIRQRSGRGPVRSSIQSGATSCGWLCPPGSGIKKFGIRDLVTGLTGNGFARTVSEFVRNQQEIVQQNEQMSFPFIQMKLQI